MPVNMPLSTGEPRYRNFRRDGPRVMSKDLPGLTMAHSASSSSSPGSNTSGFFTKTSPSHRHSPPSTDKNHHHTSRSSDNQIIKGAEILRKQILHQQQNDKKQILYLHHRAAATTSKRVGPVLDDSLGDAMEMYVDKDDSSDWSEPFPPPQDETMMTMPSTPGSSIGMPWSPAEKSQNMSSFPEADNAKHWAQYLSSDSEDEGDDERGPATDDDNTTAILARAALMMASPPTQQLQKPARVTPDSSPPQHLVQRVHEMETSTFDSSDMDTRLFPDLLNGYLPHGLLECGPPAAKNQYMSLQLQQSRPAITCMHPNSMDLLKDLQEDEKEILHQQQQREAQRRQQQQIRSRSMERVVRRDRVNSSLTRSAPAAVEHGADPCHYIVPPRAPEYRRLLRDPGFLHAQRAGIVWQSIVSQHVRFPAQWWNGVRHPPLGVGPERQWSYLGRHRVRENPFLQHKVHHRGSAGRLLLHVIVRDIMTCEPTLDLAVGCFHPNARGIRATSSADPYLEDCRDIWLAIRQRTDEVSVMESLLQHGRDADESPLGAKHAIDNENLRAVFGETPPVHTIMALESELYELFSRRLDGTVPAAAVLLEEYVSEW